MSLLRLRFPSLSGGIITFYHKYFFVLAFIEFSLLMSLIIFNNKVLLSVNGLLFIGLLSTEMRKRYSAYKAIKSKGLRIILIYELIFAAAALYVLIPKLMK